MFYNLLHYTTMQYEGKITKIYETETVGQNALPKRTLVLEEITDREYKGWIAIDFIKDKTALLDRFEVWDIVNVSLNFSARYSEQYDKHFNSINGWKIDLVSSNPDQEEDLPF